jgi:predicted RNA-binding Zn-ribbon protein involved in translation (DUF1610 family)
MSEISAPTRRRKLEPAHEAYSFACLNCGFVWEQAYEIEHVVDYNGQMVYRYKANGVPVASPLTHPACPGCGGPHVRIMASGRVARANAGRYSAGRYQDEGDRQAQLLSQHMAERKQEPEQPAAEAKPRRRHWWSRRTP